MRVPVLRTIGRDSPPLEVKVFFRQFYMKIGAELKAVPREFITQQAGMLEGPQAFFMDHPVVLVDVVGIGHDNDIGPDSLPKPDHFLKNILTMLAEAPYGEIEGVDPVIWYAEKFCCIRQFPEEGILVETFRQRDVAW
jgi:hypothetical protein